MRYTEVTKIPSIAIKQGSVTKGVRITIAIPTYKRSHLLRETLESCLAQKTTTPFAIMVVDNNPERDCETEQLIKNYTVPNLSYYKNTQNIGIVGNWNKLFELAQTDFVVMLHDDDKLNEDYIEKIDKVLKHYQEELDVIYVETRLFPFALRTLPKKKETELKTISLTPLDFQFFNVVSIVGACFNKKSVIKMNGFNEYFDPCFDYELHLRLSKEGNAIKVLKYPLSMYRVLENYSMKMSTIFSINVKDQEIQNSIIQNYPVVYKKLFHIYQKNRELLHYIGTKRVFGVNSPEINQKITELKNKITFIDKLIFLGWRVFIKLHFILKPKTTIKL